MDLGPETLQMMVQLMCAQARECLFAKSRLAFTEGKVGAYKHVFKSKAFIQSNCIGLSDVFNPLLLSLFSVLDEYFFFLILPLDLLTYLLLDVFVLVNISLIRFRQFLRQFQFRIIFLSYYTFIFCRSHEWYINFFCF